MIRCFRLPLLLLVSLAVSACASGPRFDWAGVDRDLQPATAVAQIEQRRGEPVVWGGTIVQTRNLEDATRLEILAYPLGSQQRPLTERPAQGRFLVDYPGYLEPTAYAAGRLVTVSGRLVEQHTGQVGEARYRYPLLAGEGLHLWPRQAQAARQPRVSLGVGITLGR